MSVILVRPGAVVPKDPADLKVYQFDWDTENLAVAATITASTWTITELRPLPAWSATVAYVMGDRVVSGGTIYTCLLAHTNQVPPSATYWAVVATVTALTKDNESVLVSNRTTQVRLTGGTLGQTYEVANKIVTNESPAQTKEKSFRVLIENG